MKKKIAKLIIILTAIGVLYGVIKLIILVPVIVGAFALILVVCAFSWAIVELGYGVGMEYRLPTRPDKED